MRTAGRASSLVVFWHFIVARQSRWQLQVEEKKREKAKFEKERMLLERKVARKREQVDKKVRGRTVHGTATCLQHDACDTMQTWWRLINRASTLHSLRCFCTRFLIRN